MTGITYIDNRTEIQKVKDFKKEFEEKISDVMEFIETSQKSFVDNQEIINENKLIRKKIFCKYCKQDITQNYNKRKIDNHLRKCKEFLMEENNNSAT